MDPKGHATLDPLGPQIEQMQFVMGKAHFLLAETEQTVDWLQKALASNPQLVRAHAFLALAHVQKGDHELAKLSLADVERTGPHFRLSTSPDAPSPFSPAAYHDCYNRLILPTAEKAAGVNGLIGRDNDGTKENPGSKPGMAFAERQFLARIGQGQLAAIMKLGLQCSRIDAFDLVARHTLVLRRTSCTQAALMFERCT